MFCMYCGQKLPEQAKFCFICGNKIELEIEEEAVQPVIEQEEQSLFVDSYDNDTNIFDDVNYDNDTSVFGDVNDVDDINVSEDNNCVSIDENTNSINAFGTQLSGKDPTSIYVEAVEAILKKYPQLIGQKDTYFTTDKFKADNYTGKTRELFINGSTVYVKTGFSTQAKWSNIKAICKLAGISFCLGQNAGIESEPVHAVSNTVSNTESTCDNQNIISDDTGLNKQVNPISKIDIKEFTGKFDVNAAFSRCDISMIGCGYGNENSINYVQYNNHIYFLVYKDQFGKVENDIKCQYVVFGSINLLDYKVEILKEYRSSLWAGKFYHCELGSIQKGPLISVSNNKIWYITYVQDDKDVYGDEHGNLAVKCLDIITREESIVMELPKVREAYMPIVMGNVLAYLADGKLVCHNMLTGKVSRKECKRILGYNSSYVYFTKEYCKYDSSFKYILDVNTGQFVRIDNFIKEQLMIKESFIDIYYMDCKNRYIYATLARKVKGAFDTHYEYYKACIDMNRRNVEIIEKPRIGFGYEFKQSVDGRYGNLSFDGSLYVMCSKASGASTYKDDCPEQWDYFLVRVDRDGSKHYTRCNESPDERNILVPLWDGNLIAKLNTGQISLFHNGTWHTIFDSNENV